MTAARVAGIEAVVCGVLRQAVRDAAAAGVLVLRPDTPEGRLLLAWSVRCFGAERVWRAEPVQAAVPEGEPVHAVRHEELERTGARIAARERNALLLHPANKTALLLGDGFPPEPVLPFGDLYAAVCDDIAGGWTADPVVLGIAEQAGGISALDGLLETCFERRVPANRVLQHLPERVRSVILQRLEVGRFWRRRAGLVPKLGTRTLGIDLTG